MLKTFRHHEIKKIAAYVKNGGVIIYPTDTVWGIGGSACDAAAVQKTKTLKGKPDNAKLIWLLPSVTAVEKYCGKVTDAERKMLRQKRTTVIIHGQAVRVVRSGWLSHLLFACGVPLIATSANKHGETVIKSWRQAVQVFDGQDVAVVRGRKLKQVASSLVQFEKTKEGPQMKILRHGSGISIN